MSYLLDVYSRYPISVKEAKGSFIIDKNGKRYLDFLTGIAVNILGNRNKKVVNGIKSQLEKYLHVSNLFYQDLQEVYAKEFQKISFKGKIFFSNSGAEANECALKLVRKIKKGKILCFKNSFHGRTLFTLSATDNKKVRDGFRPLKDFVFVPFNSIEGVKKTFKKYEIAGVIVEPVQGEGGVYVGKKEFFKFLREETKKRKIPLIFDEIQSGLGRCGETFCYKIFKTKPDILTSGKAAGGGLPLGVTLISDEYAKFYKKGDHASTFGGNPVSLSAGLQVIRFLKNENNIKMIKEKGKIIKNKLDRLQKFFSDKIKEIRGVGLIWGIEFKNNVASIIREKCIEKGLILNDARKNILRILPPATIKKSEIDSGFKIIEDVLKEVFK